MPLFLVLLIYNALLPLVLVVLLPVSAVKMRRRGGYGAKFWQRFGLFDGATKEGLAAVAGRCRWVHAVSVGEVNVARKLIGELLRAEPEVPVVLSVTTSTGYAVAAEGAPGVGAAGGGGGGGGACAGLRPEGVPDFGLIGQ